MRNQTKNTNPPIKTKQSNPQLRHFTMRYYFCENNNPDKVYVKKLNVRARNIGDALETFDPIEVGLYNKNFLNWTAKRIS